MLGKQPPRARGSIATRSRRLRHPLHHPSCAELLLGTWLQHKHPHTPSGLDGNSRSEALAQKPRSYDRVRPLQSPAGKQWEHMPVDMWSERPGYILLDLFFSFFKLFFCILGWMLKGKLAAHRLVFALHSSGSKPNQWKIFIKISIKPFGSRKNWGENRKEWRGKGR